MPALYAESSNSRCLFKPSVAASAQRFWNVVVHSGETLVGFSGAEGQCCTHCLNISCCACSEDCEALRKLSNSWSNISSSVRWRERHQANKRQLGAAATMQTAVQTRAHFHALSSPHNGSGGR